METEASIAAMVILICIAIWTWKAINWVWLKPKKLERYLRQQGLNGKPYKLLIGDIKHDNLMNKTAQSKPMQLSHDIVPRVLPFQHHVMRNYGKNSFTWIGPYPVINLMDPDMIKEILNRVYDFPKPKLISQTEALVSGLVRHEGQKWTKHRSLLDPAYRFDKLKLMLPAFEESCNEMIREWEVVISEKGSMEVDIWTYCHDLFSDMIARAAFGNGYQEGKKIFILQQEQVDLSLLAMKSLYIPGSRYLPTKFNRRLKQTEKEMSAMLKDIIEKREKEMKRGETFDDLLGFYMTLNSKEIEENGKTAGLTVPELIDECKAFYLAGENASSVLVTWTMVLLSMHQDWQTKAREEVLQVFGNKKPDFDGLSRLKIVTMILHEVSRLYPPAVETYRMIYQETRLGKWKLPGGVMIRLPITMVQHDQDLWGDDVNEFKPERFSSGVAEATKGQVSYFPFSWGPRTCIGKNFGMLQAKFSLSIILQRFWFELSPSYSHAPYPSVTLQPQSGAHIVLHKRV